MSKSILTILAFCCLGIGMTIGSLISSGYYAGSEQEDTEWTCSMHPQVSLPAPGPCPICEMDLIPRTKKVIAAQKDALVLNQREQELAHLETVVVKTGEAIKHLKVSARLERDETKVRALTILGSGRLDKLYANYIGMPVKKNDHLAEVFSPAFSTAAAELLATRRTQGQNSPMELSARRKLQLLGVNNEQIVKIIDQNQVPQVYTLFSPMDGVISASHGHEGEWFKDGQVLFELVNLNTLWVQMDVYESQLGMVHFGQEVDISLPSFPGRVWKGTISFIQPVLNNRTRSLKVRVNIHNADGALRPGMFADASVRVRFDNQSRIIRPSLKGKWVSPMHPEIVREKPGTCPVCGMDLISGEEYTRQQETSADQALLIPDEAPLLLGNNKAVVYIEVGKGQYAPRSITLGHHIDQAYIVLSGLKDGERIVSRDAFRIDSDLQIQARSSMMSVWQDQNKHSAEMVIDKNIQEHVRPLLKSVVEQWLIVQEHLSKGKTEHLKHQLMDLAGKVEKVPHRGDIPSVQAMYTHVQSALEQVETALKEKKSELLAPSLADFSESLLQARIDIAVESAGKWAVMHCPMVPRLDGKVGASWLQKSGNLANPFFFGAMNTCGKQKEVIND